MRDDEILMRDDEILVAVPATYAGGQDTEERRGSPVDVAEGDLAVAVDSLDAACAKLVARLDRVLRPEPADTDLEPGKIVGEAPPPMSEHVRFLRSQAHKTHVLRGRIERAIDRLEL